MQQADGRNDMVRQRRSTLDNLLEDVLENPEDNNVQNTPPRQPTTVDMHSSYRFAFNKPVISCLTILAVLAWLFLSPHGTVRTRKPVILTMSRLTATELIIVPQGTIATSTSPFPSSLQRKQELLPPPPLRHHPQLPRSSTHQLRRQRDR